MGRCDHAQPEEPDKKQAHGAFHGSSYGSQDSVSRRTSTPDLEQASGVPALDHRSLVALETRYLGDEPNWIVDTHVVGIVGAEEHMLCPVLIDHVPQHRRV